MALGLACGGWKRKVVGSGCSFDYNFWAKARALQHCRFNLEFCGELNTFSELPFWDIIFRHWIRKLIKHISWCACSATTDLHVFKMHQMIDMLPSQLHPNFEPIRLHLQQTISNCQLIVNLEQGRWIEPIHFDWVQICGKVLLSLTCTIRGGNFKWQIILWGSSATILCRAIATVYAQVCGITELLFVSYLIYVLGVGGSVLFYVLNIFD